METFLIYLWILFKWSAYHGVLTMGWPGEKILQILTYLIV